MDTNLSKTQLNKLAHTQGPWWLDGRNIRSATNKPNWQPQGIKLAQVTGGAVGFKESHGNGVVMAAAPDLLETLKKVRAALNCHYESAAIEYEFGAQIDAAIALAETEK